MTIEDHIQVDSVMNETSKWVSLAFYKFVREAGWKYTKYNTWYDGKRVLSHESMWGLFMEEMSSLK